MAADRPSGVADDGLSRSVVDRALAIIGTFQGGRVRQSLSELSRRSGVPLATSHRIVQRLSAWGALERDDDGRYRIGLRLWEVASLAPRSMGLQRIARPYLQDLYETTHCSVQLAIREGHDLVSIERFQHPRQARHRPRVGGRYALHASAIGLVLLAHAPDDVREEILAEPLRRFTERTYVRPAELLPVLADIRVKGYVISDRQVDTVHVGVAAPVFAPDGSIAAGVSVVLTHEEAEERNMVHPVRVTAMAISRALRESPDG